MKKSIKPLLVLFLGFAAVGQLVFAFYAPIYTHRKYTAQIFATIGIRYDGTDLHKLNEGAHYFGETIIGWTKFPSFMPEAIKAANLPEGATISAHMQERQNIVILIDSPMKVWGEQVIGVRKFLDQKLTDYNKIANVHIQLANVDFQIDDEQRDYMSGALIALVISLVVAAGARMWIRAFGGAFSATSKNI